MFVRSQGLFREIRSIMKGFKMPDSEHLAGFRTVIRMMAWIFLLIAATMLGLQVSADLAQDATALLSLKAAWENPASLSSWTANSSTNNGTSDVCSTWAFVTCDSEGSAVTELSLNNSGLEGTLDSQLGLLSSLVSLVLRSNQIAGTIPDALVNLTQLQHLDFNYNNLSGNIPISIGNLVSLQYLDFSSNLFLNGTIPETLMDLIQLYYLDLGFNNLNGEIPTSIGNLTSLQRLDLDTNNGLNGTIPDTMGNLTQLYYLDLSYNQLNGQIPPSIENLIGLTVLELDNNILSGHIPQELGNLVMLQALWLSSNHGLQGSIPVTFGQLSNLQLLFLFGCQFSGEIPTILGKLTNLTTLDLSNNNFNGSIPEFIGNLTSLDTLNLDTNDFLGSIPPQLGRLTALTQLDLHNANLTGSIPDSLGYLTSLTTLNLAGNFLNGSIPSSVLRLPKLITLTLDDNCLNGTMPTSVPAVFDDSNNCFDGESCNTKCVPKTGSTKQGNTTKKLIIVLFGVIGGLLFVGALLLIFTYMIRQKHHANKSNDLLTLPVHLKQYTLLEVMEATENLNTKVGEGGFSTVYKASFKDGSLAAVKHFNKLHRQENFELEIEVLAHLNHRYLVNLIGFCSEGDELMLMFDFMDRGNLFQNLHGESFHDPLTWGDRMKIITNVARGIEYLHYGSTPPLIHRDIKSSNILLSNSAGTTPINAKLADFGLGKHTMIEMSYYGITSTVGSQESLPPPTRVAGTPGYVDPEYITTFQVSPKSDVYSYGVVLLEILTGKEALFLQKQQRKLLVDWVKPRLDEKDIWSIVDPKLDKNSIPEEQLVGVVELALQCIRPTSDTRPSIREALKTLIEILLLGNVDDFNSSFKSDAKLVEMFPLKDQPNQSSNWIESSFEIDSTTYPQSTILPRE